MHRVSSTCSVWILVCRDTVACGHIGVGAVSLHGAPIALTTFATLAFSLGL